MSDFKWPRDLDYFESGEWQWVEEKLNELDGKRTAYNPRRDKLFRALDLTPFETVRVAIIGQDPYPDARFSTGVAFSIPPLERDRPPYLVNIFKEYEADLHYPTPTNGCLEQWCKEGVLLWNAVPTCETSKAGSHRWPEWSFLTKEIVERLSKKGIVFALLGGTAQSFAEYVGEESEVLMASHPSPLGAKSGKNPFLGSRIFTKINDLLCTHKIGEAINWRLD